MSTSDRTGRRPRVVCHMMASVDGRIVPRGWPLSAEERSRYDEVHERYGAEGWFCGRITMEPFAGGVRPEAEVALQHEGDAPRDDHVASGSHASFAFALDPSGRLAWRTSDIDGDHVVTILSERVSDDYLTFLRERGVSWLFAGADEIDLSLALEKIGARFGVRTLMLEGGGRTNGSFARSGLIDEVSLLLAPVVDGHLGTPALFDTDGDGRPVRLALDAVERLGDDMLWLRYRPAAAPTPEP